MTTMNSFNSYTEERYAHNWVKKGAYALCIGCGAASVICFSGAVSLGTLAQPAVGLITASTVVSVGKSLVATGGILLIASAFMGLVRSKTKR